MYIKTGDQVQVIAGKEKGRSGRILRVDHKRDRVYVEGLNIQKRHKRPNAADSEGGIVEREGPIHVSNVLLFSEKLGKGVRVSYRFVGQNGEHFVDRVAARNSFPATPERVQKVRLCTKTNEVF